jgi:hypothetical protein
MAPSSRIELVTISSDTEITKQPWSPPRPPVTRSQSLSAGLSAGTSSLVSFGLRRRAASKGNDGAGSTPTSKLRAPAINSQCHGVCNKGPALAGPSKISTGKQVKS